MFAPVDEARASLEQTASFAQYLSVSCLVFVHVCYQLLRIDTRILSII